MTLEIDSLDITPYIAFGGLQWQREDMEGSDTSRDLSGNLRRDRITTKHKLDVTCRPLTGGEASLVLTAIQPEFVAVRYYDPQEGQITTRTMYAGNAPAVFAVRQPDGGALWNGITFSLIER